jgi:hypothetical protein
MPPPSPARSALPRPGRRSGHERGGGLGQRRWRRAGQAAAAHARKRSRRRGRPPGPCRRPGPSRAPPSAAAPVQPQHDRAAARSAAACQGAGRSRPLAPAPVRPATVPHPRSSPLQQSCRTRRQCRGNVAARWRGRHSQRSRAARTVAASHRPGSCQPHPRRTAIQASISATARQRRARRRGRAGGAGAPTPAAQPMRAHRASPAMPSRRPGRHAAVTPTPAAAQAGQAEEEPEAIDQHGHRIARLG